MRSLPITNQESLPIARHFVNNISAQVITLEELLRPISGPLC